LGETPEFAKAMVDGMLALGFGIQFFTWKSLI
jgi:hypothetical protein